jgi:hypothetical protein
MCNGVKPMADQETDHPAELIAFTLADRSAAPLAQAQPQAQSPPNRDQ